MSRFPIDASSKLYTPLRLVTDPPQFSPGPNPPYFDPDFRSQRLLGGQIVTGGVAKTVDLATRQFIGESARHRTAMPVLLPCSVTLPGTTLPPTGIFVSLHRDGLTITLCIREYTYFAFGETEVVVMPHGDERWQRLVRRRYPTLSGAAQEAHVAVFGTRCNYMKDFHAYCVHHAVDFGLPDHINSGCDNDIAKRDEMRDQRSYILAAAPHIEAHLRTRIEVRPVSDGTPRASWKPVCMLFPAIALSRERVALEELKAIASSARGTQDRKRPRDVPRGEMHYRSESESRGGSSSVAKRPKYRLKDKPGTIVWERNPEAVLREKRAPIAYIVRECRIEAPRVRGGTPKVLRVEPLPVGSALEKWIHASELAPMEEQLPLIWHYMRERVTDPTHRLAIEDAVERGFTMHHRDHANHLTREQLWNMIMRTAGKPQGAPVFVFRHDERVEGSVRSAS